MSTIRNAVNHVRCRIKDDPNLGQRYGYDNIYRKYPGQINDVEYPCVTIAYTPGGTARFSNIDQIVLMIAVYSKDDAQVEDDTEAIRNLFFDAYKYADDGVTIYGMFDRKGPVMPEFDAPLNAWEGIIEYEMRFGEGGI